MLANQVCRDDERFEGRNPATRSTSGRSTRRGGLGGAPGAIAKLGTLTRLSKRRADYARHAARPLGWLSDDDEWHVTAAGSDNFPETGGLRPNRIHGGDRPSRRNERTERGKTTYKIVKRPYSRKCRSNEMASVKPSRSITTKLSASQSEYDLSV